MIALQALHVPRERSRSAALDAISYPLGFADALRIRRIAALKCASALGFWLKAWHVGAAGVNHDGGWCMQVRISFMREGGTGQSPYLNSVAVDLIMNSRFLC